MADGSMEGEVVLLETFPVNSRGGEILGKAELFPMSAESSRCSLALASPPLLRLQSFRRYILLRRR